ncbi:hypothetical protein FOL47_002541 [Perkinsus chesapeaki]|uniref:Uncharacterized protein n=1 Tax=Perkinsus chesapeaki TaxID=330153 RepID=A0A7J6MDH7_PERCH|nr:hypothetical protein FOL47_002541 [Perkinsus chesapeaki]
MSKIAPMGLLEVTIQGMSRRTKIPSPSESPTHKGNHLPTTFKASDKYATLFGPPSGEHHPAWATQKQDELSLMHERYVKQQKTAKALSRDAAWAEKRRRFLEKRGVARATALKAPVPPTPGARELPTPNRGVSTRQDHAKLNDKTDESAKYLVSSYPQPSGHDEDHTDQRPGEPIEETERADYSGTDAQRATGEASILGVGDYEERKERVRQQEKEDLRRYLKEREKTPKVTARVPSSPGGSVLPGIGSARNGEVERRRKEIQDEMRQFLSRKPLVSQRVSRARSRSPSPALNAVDPREEELRQRKKQQQLEQKKWLDEQISLRSRAKAVEAERKRREEEAEEARIQAEVSHLFGRCRLRMQNSQIELEKKKAADEEAERNRRMMDADRYNIAEAESRVRSRSTSRSPSPKLRPAAINSRPREIRKDAMTQSRDAPQFRPLWQQGQAHSASEPSTKDIPQIVEKSVLPSGSVAITSAETKNDVSLLFNAILEQQRRLGEQSAIIDELKKRVSDRERHSERDGDIAAILRDREDDITARTNKLKDLMQMLLSKLSGIEQPENSVSQREEAIPQRQTRAIELKELKNVGQRHDLSTEPQGHRNADDGPAAPPTQDNSVVLDSRPPTQDKVAPAGQTSAASTDRKSLFERSLVGTRMWLPVPQPPTTTLDTLPSYSEAPRPSLLVKPERALQSLENISSSTAFRPGTSQSSTLHTESSNINDTDAGEEPIDRVARMIREMRSIDVRSPVSVSSSDSSLDLEDAVLPAGSINSIRHLISRGSASASPEDRIPDTISISEAQSSSTVRISDDPMLQTVVLSEQFYRSLAPEPESPLWTATKDLQEDLLEAVDRICAECDATTSRLSEVLGQPEAKLGASCHPRQHGSDASNRKPFERLNKMLSSGDLHIESDVVEELKLMTMMEHELRSSVIHG